MLIAAMNLLTSAWCVGAVGYASVRGAAGIVSRNGVSVRSANCSPCFTSSRTCMGEENEEPVEVNKGAGEDESDEIDPRQTRASEIVVADAANPRNVQ